MKSQKLAHNTIADSAKQWAGAWYEENAKDNALYHAVLRQLFKDQSDFIEQCWGQFVPVARAALAKALNDKNVPEKTKEEIYDALLLDKTLPRPGNFIDPLISGRSSTMH